MSKILGLVSKETVVKTVKGAVLSTSLTTALSLAIFAYQRILEPIYGSVPTQLYLFYVVLAAGSLGIAAPWMRLWNALGIAGILLSTMPFTAHWVGVYTARFHDPVLGPLATHLVVLAPIIYLGACVRITMETSAPGSPVVATPLPAFFSLTSCFSLVKNATWFSWLPYIRYFSDAIILHALAMGAIMLWGIYGELVTLPPPSEKEKSEKEKSKKDIKQKAQTGFIFHQIYLLPLVIFLPLAQTYFRPPTLPHPLLEEYEHPTHPVRILSSTQSTNGIVVVGEALQSPDDMPENYVHSLRYLRASHSLLGGVWMWGRVSWMDGAREADITKDATGELLGDSIYSAFVLQEAARLVEKPHRRPTDMQENALIIGLGTGIAATSFIRHNISTTVVEIDPAVYEAARSYFGLPDPGPGKVFLEDAKTWVKRWPGHLEKTKSGDDAKSSTDLYDIVVHDCFSGGGVPTQIYTMEFWASLKAIMNPDGMVAVNFAGHLGSEASLAILVTLQKSFSQCRAFHDSMAELSEERMQTEFLNLVFFCTVSSDPLTFRPSRKSDYQFSYLREHILSTFPEREIDFQLIKGNLTVDDEPKYVLTDKNNKLAKYQEAGALEHWKVMREVLPDIFWETY